MTHKKQDCLERPRKKGAKFTNRDIAPDEVVQDVATGYDAKRDRWNGYDAGEHKKVYEEYEAIEAARQKLREEEIDKRTTTDLAAVRKVAKAGTGKEKGEGRDDDFGSSEDEDEDQDKYAESADAVGQKLDTKTRITVRNLRIREDTAKYLINLDPSSAYYDPKTRSMRDNPLLGVPPEEVRCDVVVMCCFLPTHEGRAGQVRWRELLPVFWGSSGSAETAVVCLECGGTRQRRPHECQPHCGTASPPPVCKEEGRDQGQHKGVHPLQVRRRGVSREGAEGTLAGSDGGVHRVLADGSGHQGQRAGEDPVQIPRGWCVRRVSCFLLTICLHRLCSICEQPHWCVGLVVRYRQRDMGLRMLSLLCAHVLLYWRGGYTSGPSLECKKAFGSSLVVIYAAPAPASRCCG